ncbi:MAG: HD domain-containing protein [Candidatus Magasanikbacteria bacterium]|nr:HD domain-containing protein [Candidatus Magasanikbacteria bacterium]
MTLDSRFRGNDSGSVLIIMSTQEQRALISYTKQKVARHFRHHRDPSHGAAHAERVRRLAAYLSAREGQPAFLAELAALLHDIGRRVERRRIPLTHHELSYRLCREWLRADRRFDALTPAQKREVLYAVRYHGNDDANDYRSAALVRDADKLDAFGKIGLRRSVIHCQTSEVALPLNVSLRLRYHLLHFFKTAAARRLVRQRRLMEPIADYLRRLNRKLIKPIRL